TNDANFFLEMLRYADEEAWGSLKDFDSPEYGRIIARTLNREQSMDTLFALGSFLETSRLIVQDFTSDSRVLVHLKMLKNVIENYACNEASEKTISFLNALKSLIPKIEKLESNYKDHLRERNDFMMQSDFAFLAIMEEIKVVHEEI